MPLATQSVPISLQGLDLKSDPKQVLPGKLLVAENVVFTQPGQLRKRNGHDILPGTLYGTTTNISNAKGVASLANDLLVFTPLGVMSYAPAAQAWLNRGRFAPCAQTSIPVGGANNSRVNADSIILNGVRVTVWEESGAGSISALVQDATTNAVYRNSTTSFVATGTKPRLVAFGNDILCFYQNGANLYYVKLNSNAPDSVGSPVNIVSDASTTGGWDACAIGSRVYFAYYSTTGPAFKFFYLDTTYAASGVTTVGNYGANCATIFTDTSQNVWFATGDTATVSVFAYTYAGASLASPTTIDTVVAGRISGIAGTGIYTVFYDVPASPAVYCALFTSAATLGSFSTTTIGLGLYLYSRPFVPTNGTPIVWCSWASTYQSTYFLLGVSTAYGVIARANQSAGGGNRSANSVANITASSTNVFDCVHGLVTRLVAQSGIVYTPVGLNVTRTDFTGLGIQYAKLRQNLVISGASQLSYDGTTLFETGFHLWPETVSCTSGGGGGLGAGTYLYAATYEWTDAYGQIHRSAASIATSYTATAGSAVNVTVPTLRLTRRSGVRIAIYRTTAGGTTFYRVSGFTSPLNSTLVNSVTFTDGSPDAFIVGNELLYSTGGVLNPAAPQPSTCCVVWKNRIFTAGGGDGSTLYYTTITQPGEAVTFSDSLSLACDPRGGPITALGVIDEKLIIFKRSKIFVLVGDGPTNTGAQNDYGDPQLLTTDIGCKNPLSVVTTDQGLMFQSDKGIYLLNRSLSVAYIGAGVEAYNGLTITGAQLVAGTNQVRFTTTTGPTLVFDYLVNQWATFTNQGAVGCETYGTSYCYVTSSATVYVEHVGQFTDGPSVPISMRVRTGWISLAGLQGFQRVRRLLVLGDYVGPHNLTVKVATNYSPAFAQFATFNATSLIAGGTAVFGAESPFGLSTGVFGGVFTPYQVKMHLKTQKCEAVQFEISDSQANAYNEGFALAGLALEVGMRQGPYKIPAARSA